MTLRAAHPAGGRPASHLWAGGQEACVAQHRDLPRRIKGPSLTAVRWDRLAFLQVALIVTVVMRTVYAAPATSTAQLRAAYCCATHCAHRRGTVRPDVCCHVTSQANDAAVLASPVALHPPLAVHFPPRSGRAPDQISLAASATVVERGSHGPPLFLRVRSLRL